MKINTFRKKSQIPQSPLGYNNGFIYENRTIFFNEINIGNGYDFKIYLYCDVSLYNNEINCIMNRSEKCNNENQKKKELEEKRRKKNKGKLTDDELSQLTPKHVDDIFKNRESLGTITLRVKAKNINGEQAYSIWKTSNRSRVRTRGGVFR